MNKVLVLNADYTALSICNIYKAFLLIFMDKAETVNNLEDQFLRSVDQCVPIPSVIRLNRYVNIPYRKVCLTRHNIFRRDRQKCVYCGSGKNLTLDHVLPKSRGGQDSWTNLVAACNRCNAKKGHQTPEEANMPLPYKPFKPSYIVFLKYFSGIGNDNWAPYLGISNL